MLRLACPPRPTRLAVALLVLCPSLAPLAAQVRIGADDVQLTEIMPPGDPFRDAVRPAVAYSPTSNHYLVAWIADDAGFGLLTQETEVFAQIFDGGDLTPISSVLRVSHVGPDMEPERGAFEVDCAWGENDDFLIVWSADDANYDAADNQAEVFSKRVSWAAGGGWSSALTRKLSDSGDGMPDPNRDAANPAVAWGSSLQEWLVVWSSDRKGAGLSAGEREIFGQRLDSTGSPVGAPTRLTHLGVLGDPQARAFSPALVYEPVSTRFFVVFHGDDVRLGWVHGHYEVFGAFVDSDLAVIDAWDQLSDTGSTLDDTFRARDAAVAIGSSHETILVAWEARVEGNGFHPLKRDIWVRALDTDGTPLTEQGWAGRMGDPTDPITGGWFPAVGWSEAGQQFLITWFGADTVPAAKGGGPDLDREVWGRSLRNPQGFGPRMAISDLGGEGPDPELFDAKAVALSSGPGPLLAVWQGDDDTGIQVDNEEEIFGELILGNWIFVDGFESGDTSAW